MKRAVLLLCLAGCGDEARPPAARDAANAVEIVHDAGPEPPARGFVGVITAAESADVAPRFEGVIKDVLVRPGDKVKFDQVVAEMDPAPLREELRAAEAALSSAQAAVRQAEIDVEAARKQVEIEKGAVAAGTSPKQALEQAELALRRAGASAQRATSTVAAERSRVETARARLADTSLRAPFAGTVAMRYRDTGSTVGAGTPIVRLVGQGALRLRFAVPPERARGLVAGVVVTATIETVVTPVPVTIRQVSPELDPASGMVIMEAELAADAGEIRPGLAATVMP